MLTGFIRAFRTPDLRKKLLFTLFIIAMFRLGACLPTPGISERNVSFCLMAPRPPPRPPAARACSSWSTCSAAARC